MADPNLRRTVWLTSPQRDLLRAAVKAAQSAGQDTHVRALLDALTAEVAATEERGDTAKSVRVTLRGLRLPVDALPVVITDAQVEVLIESGDLDRTVETLVRPAPVCHTRHSDLRWEPR